ncbi:kinase-like protein [Ophiobolus disseminans]|uniref:non-specific serine/threonine protein kinase n=1 Tax=Ophiobolus disseminans TaxID=1469910 RepID=A0A6A6ZM63_9PLEO|nr:kinase-like protein [Ophiobolus disseminans]
MPKRPWLVESDKPSYQVLKWVGGGGFGQVFKVLRNGQVVACKQVRLENAEAALDEYDHMKSLRGAPHIATLHDGLEYNRKTSTLSFFMDYYKGKDLDRQVQMLKGAAGRFTENQIIEIGWQIAVALEFCHSRNILHQDMKPMNVLLREPWNPLTQRDVPDLFVADFGIASQVQTIGTRITSQRGTPGYEAPEIRGQGHEAAFSQKSDIFAFGCILYRLCSLAEPEVDDTYPLDLAAGYSKELLLLVAVMLHTNRDARPTATQVKEKLAAIATKFFSSGSMTCRTCKEEFVSKNALQKHVKKTGHGRKDGSLSQNPKISDPGVNQKDQMTIRGAANAPVKHYYDDKEPDSPKPSPCVVCDKHFSTKGKFFKHLHGGHHYRGVNYVQKRKAMDGIHVDVDKEDERLAKWVRKDMMRHSN